jgi:hypothetical protein
MYKKSLKMWVTYDLYGRFYCHKGERSLHSDWPDADPVASSIGPQLGAGETGISGNPSRTVDVNCWRIWQVFLTLPRQKCHVTHPLLPSCAIAPLFSRSRTNYFKLFVSLLCVTDIRKNIWKRYYYLDLCKIKKIGSADFIHWSWCLESYMTYMASSFKRP